MLPSELTAAFQRAGWTRDERAVLLRGRSGISVKPSPSPGAKPGEWQVVVGADAGAYVLACGPEHVLAVCRLLAENGDALDGTDLTPLLAECAVLGAKVSVQGQWRPLFQPAPDAPAGELVRAGEEPWRDVFAANGWYFKLHGTGITTTHKVAWQLQEIDRVGDHWRVTFDCTFRGGGRGYDGPASQGRPSAFRARFLAFLTDHG